MEWWWMGGVLAFLVIAWSISEIMMVSSRRRMLEEMERMHREYFTRLIQDIRARGFTK